MRLGSQVQCPGRMLGRQRLVQMVQVQPRQTCKWEVIWQQGSVSAPYPHLLLQMRRTVHMPQRMGGYCGDG